MHKGELMMFDKADIVIPAYQEFMEVGENDESAEEDL
jgi:hypothetical protein